MELLKVILAGAVALGVLILLALGILAYLEQRDFSTTPMSDTPLRSPAPEPRCNAKYPHTYTVRELTPDWYCQRVAGHDGFHEAETGECATITWRAPATPAATPPIDHTSRMYEELEWGRRDEADRALGASLRAALATTEPGYQLEIFRTIGAGWECYIGDPTYNDNAAHNIATKALASLLRASPTETR